MNKNQTTRLLIVDDHPIFRMGMKELISQEEGFDVCAVAEDIPSARKALSETSPDMAIVDISLGSGNGLELVREMVSHGKKIPVLVLSMHDETVWAERALRAGAMGYMMKKEASESVVTAVKTILGGNIHVSAAITARMLDRFQIKPGLTGAPTENRLTDRELEVFQMIGQGLSSREIADKIKLSIKTIGTYRDRIRRKLCIKSSAELARRAVLWTEKESFGKTKKIP